MEIETPVVEPVVTPEPVVVAPVVNDPFALDEAKLASFTPEQRATLAPVLDEWKTRARGEIEKTAGKTYEDKYKPHMEKATALDHLVKDPRFVQWWQNIQQAAVQQNPGATQAINQTKPQDIATPEEYQQAIMDASTGDGTKLRELQTRMWSVMATPVISQLQASQQQIAAQQADFRTTMEMKDLFDRHPDTKELDLIGRNPQDPNDQSESLLASCLMWADSNGRPLEEGYMRAKKWADAMRVGAQQQAMGLVQGKKETITSGPSTTKAGQAVVEVADADELMQRNMEYVINKQTPPRFVIRPSVPNRQDRWAQKT